MPHNSRAPSRPQQLAARRREHTPVKRSTLDLAQMLVWPPPPLQAVNQPQPQAHSDTQANNHSNPPTVCLSSQHTVSQVMQTRRRRNSNRHMGSLHTASLATTLLTLDTLNNPHPVLRSPASRA
jgi:hypothetical protein